MVVEECSSTGLFRKYSPSRKDIQLVTKYGDCLKSLYGTKQAAHNWSRVIDDILKGLGFTQSRATLAYTSEKPMALFCFLRNH